MKRIRNLTDRRRRVAALIDVENVTIVEGARLSERIAASVLSEVAAYASGHPTHAAMAESLARPYLGLLASKPWSLQFVQAGNDAADRALVERGIAFIESGYTDLILVSGDHGFSHLARHARLHVVSHPASLSNKLKYASESVTLLASPCFAAAA